MYGDVKFTINSKGIEKMLKSKGMEKMLSEKVDKVRIAAIETAPSRTGTYVGSIRSVVEEHPSRLVGKVVAEVPYALKVEASHGTLGRALDALGGA